MCVCVRLVMLDWKEGVKRERARQRDAAILSLPYDWRISWQESEQLCEMQSERE